MLARFSIPAALAILVLAAPVFAAPSNPNYSLIETTPLPGPVRWDFLTYDAPTHHLFVTQFDRVDVFDVNSKKVIATIGGLQGVHGAALVPSLNKGFISEGQANRVTVFNLKTFKPIAKVTVGTKPDTIIYDKSLRKIFVADADSADFSVIDPKTNKVSATIKLDGAPEYAVTDGKDRLYVNLEDKSQIDVIDLKKLLRIAHYDLAPDCEGPTGLAMNRKDNVLFSVCANKHMVIVDAATGTIKDILDIDGHPDAALYDDATGLAFSSNGEGTLTVVGKDDDGHYGVLQSVATQVTARTMALDPETHDIYLSAGETEGFDPPTEKHPEPRPHVKPDTFMILKVGQQK